MSLANVFAFAALILLLFTIIRSRKRIKTMERERSLIQAGSSKEYEQSYNESQIVKLVNVCRELEGKVQSKSMLLEKLIEDADKKIAELKALKESIPEQTQNENDFTQVIYEQVEEYHQQGKSDAEIADLMKRSVGEINLIRSLGKHSQQ